MKEKWEFDVWDIKPSKCGAGFISPDIVSVAQEYEQCGWYLAVQNGDIVFCESLTYCNWCKFCPLHKSRI